MRRKSLNQKAEAVPNFQMNEKGDIVGILLDDNLDLVVVQEYIQKIKDDKIFFDEEEKIYVPEEFIECFDKLI